MKSFTLGDMSITLMAELTCPACGFKKVEQMPESSCLFFYECENCKKC